MTRNSKCVAHFANNTNVKKPGGNDRSSYRVFHRLRVNREYSMRKNDQFWYIEAWKYVLVDPKYKIINIEKEHNRSSLTRTEIND